MNRRFTHTNAASTAAGFEKSKPAAVFIHRTRATRQMAPSPSVQSGATRLGSNSSHTKELFLRACVDSGWSVECLTMIRTAALLVLSFCLYGCTNQKSPVSDGPALRLTATDGRSYEPLAPGGQSASVLVVVLQDCPICNAYAPRVQRLASQFASRGVRFFLVQVDPTLSTAGAAAHAKEYGYTFPVLIDRGHELVKRLGVSAVPTAVVLDARGRVQYKGRIDNRYFSLGKSREAATTDDLRTALKSVVDGKPVQVARTKVIGCAVPDLPQTGDAR